MDIARQAIERLSGSERGRNALRRISEWLDDDGIGLDERNQNAALTLLTVAWKRPGSTRDMLRDAVERQTVNGG